MLSLPARDPVGTLAPGRYFPVSTPCARGDQTIWEMPFLAQKGMIPSSGRRHSSEYCGWLETKRSVFSMANVLAICRVDHSLNPM
jgi:hypothetical protein